jgi:predicted permease
MMFSAISSILAPIFITVFIGFCWFRSGRSYDTALITSIVTYFGAPCLIFYSLSSVTLDHTTLLNMGLAALLANVAFTAAGGFALGILRLSQRAFLMTLAFPNLGNVGLSLCYLSFGKDGLALAVTFFAIFTIFQMTVGVAIVSGSVSLKSMVRMPIVPATLGAVFFLFTGTPVPEWLFITTKLIGDMTIPLMLFTLGVSLAQLKVGQLRVPVILSLVRLVMGFGVGVGLVSLLHFTGPAAGVVILQCSMPAAVFSYLFAQLYDQQPEEVAGVVIVSTVLGFALLPALLWYIL